MKKLIVLIPVLIFISSQAQHTLELISHNHQEHLNYLCSEELKGRKTGENGQKLAAQYIAAQFKEAGLSRFEQLPDSTPYYQPFYLYFWNKGKLIVKQEDTSKYTIPVYPVTNERFIDSLPMNLKLAGFMHRHHMPGFDKDSYTPALIITKKTESRDLAETINKYAETYKLNRLVISFSQNLTKKNRLISETVFSARLQSKRRFEKWNRRHHYLSDLGKGISKDLKVYYLPYYALARRMTTNHNKFDKFLKKEYKYSDTLDLKMHLKCVNVNAFKYVDSVKTENVVAYIPGKTDKNIILTAHYDHIGQNYKGVCPGADDNASGTSVIIEVAKGLNQKPKPNCNIIFIAFTGEEMGLYGSKYYTENPIEPLAKTVGVLNFDMVGRPDKHSTHFVHAVFAGGDKSVLKKPIKKTAESSPDFYLDLHPGLKERMVYYFASDHFAFTSKNVTNAVFFTDDHKDYHTPSDTPDKINYENMAAITSFIQKCVLAIDANQ
jgi:hypothetical protein